ncbi:unnamed protein product [Angiostrongylus costaricensis]|uniref:Uncharacterized protein n=1 Tax=Angiostrongylus costaricensis TaxID=334426 RepID=A0A0R3PI46_ANGCS|nr:unnamed protein product [Angiostrongylus costaricensis]
MNRSRNKENRRQMDEKSNGVDSKRMQASSRKATQTMGGRKDVDIVDIVSFIDYFIRTAFFKMTSSEEMLLFLASIESNTAGLFKDWSWSLCFVLSAICCIPECTYSRLIPLVAKWFAQGDRRVADAIYKWIKRWRSRHGERKAIEK